MKTLLLQRWRSCGHFARHVLFSLFVQFTDSGELFFGCWLVAAGLVGPGKPVVRIRLFRIQCHGTLQRSDGIPIMPLLRKNCSQIEMRDANVVSGSQSPSEQARGASWIVFLHRNVAKIGQRLRVIRINRQLALEFGFRLIVLLELPMQVAKTKMNVGFLWTGLCGLLELRNGFWSPSQAV